MAQTLFTLPSAIVSNPASTPSWSDPTNILLVDGNFAVSGGPAQVLTTTFVGNVNLSVGDAITNIILQIQGYRGSFNTTLQIFAVDTTTGVEYSYPYTPNFQGFTGTNTIHTLASSLFGTTWTVNQINNIQIRLVADGELHIDDIRLSVEYIPAGSPIPPTPIPGGEIVCHEFVQAQPFSLAQAMTATSLFAFLSSFSYTNGDLIQITDFSGGVDHSLDPDEYGALLVLDQGNSAQETFRIWNVEHDYNGTGLVRLTLGTILNRGLLPRWPYTHDVNNTFAHAATAEVVISNSAAFYDRFLKKCQIGALVSAPIEVLSENVSIVYPATKFNFHGSVTVVQDGVDPEEADIYITNGGGTTPPQVVDVNSDTSGNLQVPVLTYPILISGVNRAALIQISTEESSTITSVDVGGTPAVLVISNTDVPNNLRSEQWICVAPPLGPQTVTITLSSPAYISSGTEAMINVDPVTPTGTTQISAGNSNNPTLSLVTTYDNSLIFDSLVTAQTPIVYTPGSGQTIEWSHTSNTDTRQGSSSVEPSGLNPDNITMDYNITQITDWVYTATEIKGITTPSSTGQVAIQFEDETGTPLGTPGTVDEFEITGGGVLGTRVGNKVTYTLPGTGTDELVKVSVADTTPGYLQPKLNIHSSDASVIVTPTITNPAGNEILDIDLTGAGAGTELFTVNADETLGGVITTPLNPADNSWTNGTPVYRSNGVKVDSTSSYKSSTLSGYENATPGWTILQYGITTSNPGKKIRLRWEQSSTGSSATAYILVGFSDTVTPSYRTNTVDKTIRIVTNDTTAFAVTSDGTTNTNTDLVVSMGFANPHTYTIVWDPGTDVKFYVDGVLKATHITSIPTDNTAPFVWVTGAGGGTNTGYVNGIVLSQEV